MTNTRFMYNFKKVGNEYVPEANRADYDYLVSQYFRTDMEAENE